MAKYTKVNFREIDNSSGAEGKDMRFARKFLGSSELGVTLILLKPNHKDNRGHKHRVQEEVYVVINGSGQILLDGEVENLKQWDTVRVAPETVRAFAAGADGLEVIAVGGSKPAEGDGEPGEVDWPAN